MAAEPIPARLEVAKFDGYATTPPTSCVRDPRTRADTNTVEGVFFPVL